MNRLILVLYRQVNRRRGKQRSKTALQDIDLDAIRPDLDAADQCHQDGFGLLGCSTKLVDI